MKKLRFARLYYDKNKISPFYDMVNARLDWELGKEMKHYFIHEINGWTDGKYNYSSYISDDGHKLWESWDKASGLHIMEGFTTLKIAQMEMNGNWMQDKIAECKAKEEYKKVAIFFVVLLEETLKAEAYRERLNEKHYETEPIC